MCLRDPPPEGRPLSSTDPKPSSFFKCRWGHFNCQTGVHEHNARRSHHCHSQHWKPGQGLPDVVPLNSGKPDGCPLRSGIPVLLHLRSVMPNGGPRPERICRSFSTDFWLSRGQSAKLSHASDISPENPDGCPLTPRSPEVSPLMSGNLRAVH